MFRGLKSASLLILECRGGRFLACCLHPWQDGPLEPAKRQCTYFSKMTTEMYIMFLKKHCVHFLRPELARTA